MWLIPSDEGSLRGLIRLQLTQKSLELLDGQHRVVLRAVVEVVGHLGHVPRHGPAQRDPHRLAGRGAGDRRPESARHGEQRHGETRGQHGGRWLHGGDAGDHCHSSTGRLGGCVGWGGGLDPEAHARSPVRLLPQLEGRRRRELLSYSDSHLLHFLNPSFSPASPPLLFPPSNFASSLPSSLGSSFFILRDRK